MTLTVNGTYCSSTLPSPRSGPVALAACGAWLSPQILAFRANPTRSGIWGGSCPAGRESKSDFVFVCLETQGLKQKNPTLSKSCLVPHYQQGFIEQLGTGVFKSLIDLSCTTLARSERAVVSVVQLESWELSRHPRPAACEPSQSPVRGSGAAPSTVSGCSPDPRPTSRAGRRFRALEFHGDPARTPQQTSTSAQEGKSRAGCRGYK